MLRICVNSGDIPGNGYGIIKNKTKTKSLQGHSKEMPVKATVFKFYHLLPDLLKNKKVIISLVQQSSKDFMFKCSIVCQLLHTKCVNPASILE